MKFRFKGGLLMRIRSSAGRLLISLVFLLVFVAQITQAAPTKIVFWFRQLTDLQTQTFNAWKAGFEEKNPAVTVEWEIPPGDWMTKLPILVASGMGPDVFEVWGVYGRDWGLNGVTLDIAPYVKRDFTAKDIQDFYPASWQATEIQYGSRRGVRYGLPSNGNIFLMYYNKDMKGQGLQHHHPAERSPWRSAEPWRASCVVRRQIPWRCRLCRARERDAGAPRSLNDHAGAKLMIERRPALGKGLSALIPDVPEPPCDVDYSRRCRLDP
jgi:hypothetical protein